MSIKKSIVDDTCCVGKKLQFTTKKPQSKPREIFINIGSNENCLHPLRTPNN